MKRRLTWCAIVLVILVITLYFGGVFYMFNKPYEYRGRQLAYHYEQLKRDGFSFLFKAEYPYTDQWLYIYKENNVFNLPRYMVLELKSPESPIVLSATKYAYIFWSAGYGMNSSWPLADDNDGVDVLDTYLPWMVPVAEDERFLLN